MINDNVTRRQTNPTRIISIVEEEQEEGQEEEEEGGEMIFYTKNIHTQTAACDVFESFSFLLLI